jgi:uncharacterized protein (DUF302 family)
MSYYFSKTLFVGFDEALRRTIDALKHGGFGIITEVDVKQTFQEKLGIDFRNYLILGACNPRLAYEARHYAAVQRRRSRNRSRSYRDRCH